MAFRYLLDPLFLFCFLLYFVNRWILEVYVPGTFFASYLNDLICIPFWVPIMLFFMRKCGLRGDDSPPRSYEIIVPLILWSLGCVAIYVLLRYTRFGHYSYSIGANPLACRVSGVRVDYWRFLMFVLEGALAGFGGLLIISQTGSAATTQWGSAGLGSQFDVIAAVILGGAGLAGGRGSIVGTVLGMILLGVLANGMTLTGIPPFWHTVLRGLILLVAILVDTWRTGGFR